MRQNDPFDMHADAAAVRRRRDEIDQHVELQRQLPDLQVARAAILRDKAETAEAIAKFGADGAAEKNPRRQRLVDRFQALNLSLEAIDRQIDDTPRALHPHDKASHVAGQRRRAGVSQREPRSLNL